MNHFMILVYCGVGAALVGGGLLGSYLLAPRRPGGEKNAAYECGERTIGPSWVPFHVGYYVFALLFLAFDVEAAFLFPWAVALRDAGVPGLVSGGVFLFILAVGLVYAWRKKALEWV